MNEWWKHFFDADYLRLWEGPETPEKTEGEADELWKLLSLNAGSRVLDAPCGYGRLSLALAGRGANVLGLDQSRDLLAVAEQRRGDIPSDRLRYQRHDLRDPIPESGFDTLFMQALCRTGRHYRRPIGDSCGSGINVLRFIWRYPP